mgnify:FL=1
MNNNLSPKIGILLSQINGTALTEKCLDSINKSKYNNLSIYIGDNFSDNLEVLLLSEKFPDANIYIYKKRLSYCETFNYLAEKAIKDGCEYIFVVNNDTKDFSINFFEEAIFSFSDPLVGMVGTQSFDYDGNVRHSFGTLKNKLGESVVIPTSGFFVRSLTWNNVGGFNEKLKMYGEDLKLIRDVNKNGWKIINNSNVSFSHLGEATIKNFPYTKIFLRTRNGLWLLKSFDISFNDKVKFFYKWIKPTIKKIILSSDKKLIFTIKSIFVFFAAILSGIFVKKLS